MQAEDVSYDPVFDLVIIHHIGDWRAAIGRSPGSCVPNGRFYLDEVTATALARPNYRALFEHPADERVTAGEFLAELDRHGLHTGERWRTHIGGDYLLGVAHRRI